MRRFLLAIALACGILGGFLAACTHLDDARLPPPPEEDTTHTHGVSPKDSS